MEEKSLIKFYPKQKQVWEQSITVVISQLEQIKTFSIAK